MQWRLVEQAAAETATGFKKEIRLGGPPFTPHWHRARGRRALTVCRSLLWARL